MESENGRKEIVTYNLFSKMFSPTSSNNLGGLQNFNELLMMLSVIIVAIVSDFHLNLAESVNM